ncbi:hypothetical protein ANCCAN_12648 [Ancylostoma caninum]|uniref:Uncharacterized protein n=1 Tax=Ancylostoma caninum TaxID=29170 RepID=A0A368GAI2_ANCCA|nr:hypothetical protein ANCCAN_12648 [Ancylostoma caninum]
MASVLNEDDLLRTPDEVDSQDEMDLEEGTNDSVSALYNKEFDKLAAKILSQLNLVGITCDSELGKSMRTDDPRRECIMASVQEQKAVAKEIVKGTLAELHDLGCPQVGADLIQALKQSRIYKGTQLQKRLERHKAIKKMEHLRQQVEELGHVREADVQQKSGIEQRPAPVEGLRAADLDAISPQVLREYAERRIREQSRNTTFIGHR